MTKMLHNIFFLYFISLLISEMKVDMTSPVTTKILPGEGPNCENTFTVSFYIPPLHQENPPVPTNPEVFIEKRASMNVWVRSFGGFAKDNDYLSEAEKLTDIVNKSAEKDKFTKNTWYTAGYNSPFQLFGRTNEVWFIKD